MGIIAGQNCRFFELDLALALRLIKTAALARRAHRRELSETLFRQAQQVLPEILAEFAALDPGDRTIFSEPTEELRDRVEGFLRLPPIEAADARDTPPRSRSARP